MYSIVLFDITKNQIILLYFREFLLMKTQPTYLNLEEMSYHSKLKILDQ